MFHLTVTQKFFPVLFSLPLHHATASCALAVVGLPIRSIRLTPGCLRLYGLSLPTPRPVNGKHLQVWPMQIIVSFFPLPHKPQNKHYQQTPHPENRYQTGCGDHYAGPPRLSLAVTACASFTLGLSAFGLSHSSATIARNSSRHIRFLAWWMALANKCASMGFRRCIACPLRVALSACAVSSA